MLEEHPRLPQALVLPDLHHLPLRRRQRVLQRAQQRVAVSGRCEAVGRSSVELSSPATWVFGFRAGKIAYWKAYTSRVAALEAVGLQE